MLPKLYHDLEYDKVAGFLSAGCHSAAGKAKALALHPLQDIAAIRHRLVLLAQIQEVLALGTDFDFRELLELSELFGESKQLVYDYEQFRLAYLNAFLANEICARRTELEGYRKLFEILGKLTPLKDVSQTFERIFDAEGEIKDNASDELKRIRKKKVLLREQIIRSLQKKFTDIVFENALQEKFVTQREGRYVIPVKESHVPQIKGIVQGHSGSKATVFMEPEDVVGANNDLQMLQQEEKREIFRIFQSFSDLVRAQEIPLTRNYELMAELDFLFSCGRLGRMLQSKVPEIMETPAVEIKGGRHPLLILQKGEVHKVVPFELKLGDTFDFMVLSGPNTGGKTVLLKAVGLLTLIALSGLPIPVADGTKIGRFEHVAADIGDEQSIEHALSTFSSHISKIKTILDICNEKSLVLFDEICAATDPQQGSGLAQAIVETIVKKGAKGIATTHYTALKVFAEGNDRCTNASMQFDLKALTPTYKFEPGFPGDSFAIEVAASLGLDASLINRAKELTGSQNQEFTELIKKLQEEKKQLATASWQVQLRSRNLEASIHEYEQRNKKFEDDVKTRRKELLKEHQQELINSQKQLLKELDEIRHSDKEERRKKTTDMVEKLQNLQQDNQDKINTIDNNKRQKAFNPKPGDRVWLKDFETNAVIQEIKDDTVLVDMNGIQFKTRLENIYESQAKQEQETVFTKVSVNPEAHYELKLLGLTFDEAQPMIDEFIDNAVVAGLHSLRIVHGKGTGALRTKVRDYLKTRKQVKTIGTPSPSAGGSGVTIVSL